MVLAITTLSVCGLFSVFYTAMRLKYNNKWGTVLSVLSMIIFLIGASLALFNVNNNFNSAFVFIFIGLLFGLVADLFSEFKNENTHVNTFLTLGMVSYFLQRALMFTALIFLIFDAFRLEVFLISIAIAIGLTLFIIFICKIIKLNLNQVFIPLLLYFLSITFFVSVAVWYSFYVPAMIMFSLSFLMFFFSDLCLLKTHLGSIRGKDSAFIIHNIFYFIGNLLILAFLFFSLF